MQELKAEITRINREISSASARRDTLQGQLRQAEKDKARLQREIAANRSEIGRQQGKLTALQADQAALEKARQEQAARVAVELRTAWQMGQQGQVKVLLNQESPDTVARMMAYYRYFFQARNELLEQYRQTLAELQATETAIAAALAELETRQATLAAQQQGLEKAQQNRQLAMAKLNESIAGKGSRLQELENDQRELQELLDAIEEAVVNLRVPENYQPFSAAKGKMPWPVPGRASHRFGTSRNEGKMRWQGVRIPGTAGTPVRAIHHGRVVYADWLRGMGLLIIVDHGDDYMSLYAHNETLLKDVGEWVTAETPISTVGDTGGLDRPALYFEVRHKGKPVNPASWCRK